jgi:FkbM family methyltransferase
MATVSTKLVRFLIILIAKVNSRFPAIIELDMKHMQGKGKGGESVSAEVKAAFGVLAKYEIPNPIILDVGANEGLYTRAILDQLPNAKVFAFEPSSTSRALLVEKFRSDNRVSICPFALGSKVESRTLYSDQAGSGLASLTKRRLGHFNIDFKHEEIIEVTTLDIWAHSKNLLPHFVKIDVEGHELEVLKGGADTLKSVKVIQFEFGGCNIDTRTFFQDFWYFFQDLGFNLYRITPSGPLRIERYSEEDEYFSTTNYLAVRELVTDVG